MLAYTNYNNFNKSVMFTGWTKRLETARVLFSNWVSSAGSANSIRALRTGISRLSIVHHLLLSAKPLKSDSS